MGERPYNDPGSRPGRQWGVTMVDETNTNTVDRRTAEPARRAGSNDDVNRSTGGDGSATQPRLLPDGGTSPSEPLGGGGGGRSWLPSGISPLAIIAVVVVVAGVAAAGAFVATGGDLPLVGGGDSASLDAVPDGVDVVAYADGDIVEDSTTETLMDGALAESEGGPTSYDELLEEADGETDLDVDGFDAATVFAQYPEDGSAASAEYAGAILESEWSESDLVDAIESDGQSLDEQSYGDTTVYVQSSEFGADTWLAPLGDGTYAMGTEAAVTDAIDVDNGEADPLGGDLRESITDLRDGHVKFATTMPASAGEAASGVPQADQMTQNVESAAGVYYTSGGDVGLELHVTGTDESGAESVKETVDGLLSFAAVGSSDDATSELIDAIDVEEDGRVVSLSFEYAAEDLVDVLEQQSNQTAPA